MKKILPQGYLPPPFPLKQSFSGFEIPLPEKQDDTKFAPLLLRLSLNMRPEQKQFPIMPYDFYCPSVQSVLDSRVCPHCGFYTSSKNGSRKHRKAMHPKGEPLTTSRVRPRRVIARREKEFLCLLHLLVKKLSG